MCTRRTRGTSVVLSSGRTSRIRPNRIWRVYQSKVAYIRYHVVRQCIPLGRPIDSAAAISIESVLVATLAQSVPVLDNQPDPEHKGGKADDDRDNTQHDCGDRRLAVGGLVVRD